MIWLACELGRNLSPIAPAHLTAVDQAQRVAPPTGFAAEVGAPSILRYLLLPTVAALAAGWAALGVMISLLD
jgi:hypothetical protein